MDAPTVPPTVLRPFRCGRRCAGPAPGRAGALPAAAFALALSLAIALAAVAPARAGGDAPPPPPLPPESALPAPAAAPASADQAPATAEAADSDPMTPAARHRDRSKAKADVTIEQRRVGRRVSELVVTPAGFTYNYTIDHLDGLDPASVLQPHPELSTPRFLRFDFNF